MKVPLWNVVPGPDPPAPVLGLEELEPGPDGELGQSVGAGGGAGAESVTLVYPSHHFLIQSPAEGSASFYRF